MKTISLQHDGFHGLTRVSLRVPDDAEPGDVYHLTQSQYRRLKNACCSSPDCRCGEALYGIDHSRNCPWEWRGWPFVLVHEPGHAENGYYPQGR